MLEATINYTAVLIAAIANFVIGFIWYSPPVFGKIWMKLASIKPKNDKSAMMRGMVLGLLTSFVMACTLAYVVEYAQATTLMDGAMVGFWIWLGFVATILMGTVLWEGKSWKLYLLNAAYYLVSLKIMGAIIAIMA
jgi:hypothetical protein